MKRPGTVIVFSILILLGILYEFFGSIITIVYHPSLGIVGLIFVILHILLLIPRGIMITKFFLLQKRALFWVHVSYGSILGLSILQYLVFFVSISSSGRAVVHAPSLLIIGVYLFLWWAVADYIKKKEVDGQPLFT
ncbi:MAG: hypothetical protein QW594_04240 [Candidatus Woesearchaeota archaeon]